MYFFVNDRPGLRVDDSRIRKEKVADSKISGYVWTGPKVKNKIVIQSVKKAPRSLSPAYAIQ